MEHFLALSPLEKGLVVAGLLALALYSFVKLLGKRKRIEISIGSPNGDSDGQERQAKTSSTERLELIELEWRRAVEAEIREVKRELFEPERAVRGGDHRVRGDMAKAILQSEETQDKQFRDLKAEIREQFKEFKVELREDLVEFKAEIREDLARGNCCTHCP